jgi:hypothetical protein
VTKQQFVFAIVTELRDEGYKFDPATILIFVNLFIEIWQKCKKPQDVDEAFGNIAAEWQRQMKFKSGERCPPRFKAAFKTKLALQQNGGKAYTKAQMNAVWQTTSRKAFMESKSVSKFVLA